MRILEMTRKESVAVEDETAEGRSSSIESDAIHFAVGGELCPSIFFRLRTQPTNCNLTPIWRDTVLLNAAAPLRPFNERRN
jgi:hypothetical protein